MRVSMTSPFVLALLTVAALATPLQADDVAADPVAAALAAAQQARELQDAGRPREAVTLRERAIALRLGANGSAAGPELARLYTDQARTLETLEEYERAEEPLRRALELRETLHGEGHPVTLELLRRLAAVVGKTRPDDPEAEQLLLRRHAYDESWASRRDLALFYRDRDRLESAVEHLTGALRLAEADVRSGIWRLPMTLSELAEVHLRAGQLTLAEATYLRSLEARELQLGSRHPQLTSALREIGAFYVEQEDWIEAEAHLGRALEIRETAFGSCDSCNRDIVTLLTTVYEAQGRSIDFCTEGAEVAAATEPQRVEPDTTTVRADSARREDEDHAIDALLRHGEFALAREQAQRAAEQRREEHGAESLEVAASLLREARAASRMKRYADEIELRERRMTILETRFGPEHVSVASELEHLARAARRLDDPDGGIVYLQREIPLREAAGRAMPLARATARLGDLEDARGNRRVAANHYLHASDLWEQVAGADAREYVEVRIDLAESYRRLGLVDEAEATLAALLEREDARERTRFATQLRLLEALEGLYDATERPEAAREIGGRLTELRGLPRPR